MGLFGLTSFEGLDAEVMGSMGMSDYLRPQYAAQPGFGNPGDSDPGLMQGGQYMSNVAAGMRAQEQQMLEAEMMEEYWARASARQAQIRADQSAGIAAERADWESRMEEIIAGAASPAEIPALPDSTFQSSSDGTSPTSTHPLTTEGQSSVRARQNMDRPRADNPTAPPPSGSWLADFLGSLPSHALVNTRDMPSTSTDAIETPSEDRIGGYRKPSPGYRSYGQGSYGQ